MKAEFDEETTEFLNALSPSTRLVYSRALFEFQTFYGRPLNEFLSEVEEDRLKPRRERKRVARKVLGEFIRWLQGKGLSPKTISSYVSAVQSFGSYYEVPISVRYAGLPSPQPISKKFPWNLEWIAKFVGAIGDLELKSFTVTLFQTGLSTSDALSLTYGDIKFEYEDGIVPLCIDLSRKKTKTPFMTFLGKWGVRLLREYLRGRKLSLSDPLYTISPRMVRYYFKRLGDSFIGEHEGRNPMRPHSLRAAFRTLLGDAGMDRDVIKFFMGQKLPEHDRVYHSRSRDGWRELYAKYEWALTPADWEAL